MVAITSRRLGVIVGLTALALAVPLASSASAARTITWGSTLSHAPSRTLSAPVDAAYWQQTVAPRAGQVVSVTLWGVWRAGSRSFYFRTCARSAGDG